VEAGKEWREKKQKTEKHSLKWREGIMKKKQNTKYR